MTSLVLSLTTRDGWSAPVAKAMKNVVANAKDVKIAFDGIDGAVKRVQNSVEGLSKAIQQLVVDQKKIGSGLSPTLSTQTGGLKKSDDKLLPKLPELPGSSDLAKLGKKASVIIEALNIAYDLIKPATVRGEGRDTALRAMDMNLSTGSSAEERQRNRDKRRAIHDQATRDYGDISNNAGYDVMEILTRNRMVTGDNNLEAVTRSILKNAEIYGLSGKGLAEKATELKKTHGFSESQLAPVLERLFQDMRAANLNPHEFDSNIDLFIEKIKKETTASGGNLAENAVGRKKMEVDEASYRESSLYASRLSDRAAVRASDGLHLGDIVPSLNSVFITDRYPNGGQPIPPVKWPVFSKAPEQSPISNSENKTFGFRPVPPVKWPVFPDARKRPSVQEFPIVPLSIFPLRTLEYPKEYLRVGGTSSVPNFVKRNQPTDAVLIQRKGGEVGDKSNDKINATLMKASGSIDKCAGTFQQAAIAMNKPVQVVCSVDLKSDLLFARLSQRNHTEMIRGA